MAQPHTLIRLSVSLYPPTPPRPGAQASLCLSVFLSGFGRCRAGQVNAFRAAP